MSTEYKYVYMVESQQGQHLVWIGNSIHMTEAEATAVLQRGERVTPFVVSDPERTVKAVSARLATRKAA